MTDRVRASAVVILAAPLAVVLATVWVASNGGFGRGDIQDFAFWSTVFIVPLLFTFRCIAPVLTRFRRVPRAVLGLGFGALSGLLFTFTLALGMGPWIGAFSFPILYIWMTSAGVVLSGGALLLTATDARATIRRSIAQAGIALASFALVGILPIGLMLGSALLWGRAQDETYLLPQGFEGPVFVLFDQPSGEALPIVDGRRIIEVPSNGIVVTSSSMAEGWKNPSVFQRQPDGSRLEVKTDWARMDTMPGSIHTHWLATRFGGMVNGVQQPTMRYESFTVGRHDREREMGRMADALLDSLWVLYAR